MLKKKIIQFGTDATFKIYVVITATSSIPLNIVMKIYLTNSNVFTIAPKMFEFVKYIFIAMFNGELLVAIITRG